MDDAVQIVLVHPVFTGFQWSSSCTTDGTPAGGTDQENKRVERSEGNVYFFLLEQSTAPFQFSEQKQVNTPEQDVFSDLLFGD